MKTEKKVSTTAIVFAAIYLIFLVFQFLPYFITPADESASLFSYLLSPASHEGVTQAISAEVPGYIPNSGRVFGILFPIITIVLLALGIRNHGKLSSTLLAGLWGICGTVGYAVSPMLGIHSTIRYLISFLCLLMTTVAILAIVDLLCDDKTWDAIKAWFSELKPIKQRNEKRLSHT